MSHIKRINTHSFGRRHGMSIVEVMVATTISSIAMVAVVGLMYMIRTSMEEGIWENNLRSQGSLFIEKVKKDLTFAYRNDALIPALRPIIASGKNSITFFTPDDNNDGSEESYFLGFDNNDASKLVLRRNGTTISELNNVTKFNIDTQEGLINYMITIRRDLKMGSRSSTRQFTLVGRALPRNMGKIIIE